MGPYKCILIRWVYTSIPHKQNETAASFRSIREQKCRFRKLGEMRKYGYWGYDERDVAESFWRYQSEDQLFENIL